MERRSYGKDSILSTLLWGGYYHVRFTDKVIETWDEYFVAQEQRCSFGGTGFCVKQLRFRPCLLTAPTPATDEERKRQLREHCGSGCLCPLPGQYLISCYFLLAGPCILFWETLWKYTVPHALGNQFWQTRSKQKPTEFASHRSYHPPDKQIDSAGTCCFPFFFPLSPAEMELSTREGGKALLWLKD